jgi:hypothetical protein
VEMVGENLEDWHRAIFGKTPKGTF